MELVKPYLKRLKTILQYDLFYYVIVLLSLIFVFVSTSVIKYNSIYNISDNQFQGYIKSYYIDGNYLKLELDAKEDLTGSYYFKSLDEKNNFIENIELGFKIKLAGNLVKPTNNTIPNQFNYRKYLHNQVQFYTINIDQIIKISDNNNLFYKIKNHVCNKIDGLEKSKAYLKAFILGDNSDIPNDIKNIYQNIGISHLFAVSGMHVGLLSSILLRILKICNVNQLPQFLIIVLFLFLYMFLTDFSPSILRASIFFILISLNKMFSFKVKIINVLLLTISIILFINPFIIYNIGFLFSSLISIYLIVFGDLIKRYNNYLSRLVMTSLIALMVSIPISIYNFFSFNCFSILYNIVLVPFVTMILFPLSIIAFIVPCLDEVLFILISIMEKVVCIFDSFATSISFAKPPLLICFGYYIVITLALYYLKQRKFGFLLLFLAILFFHYNYSFIIKKDYLLTMDVGQGDSILLQYKNKTIVVDTGGKLDFKKEEWEIRKNNKTMADSTLIPLFKSLGLKKIDYLLLTHGDYDHMGEAINLVENFKVEKVIFNCGEFNGLEQELIKVLDKKKISYYSCIKELNIDNNKMYFLNNKNYGNENDNSSVIYTELNNYKFLFMGDAGVEVEEELIKKYNLQDIDVLKVGHHGSKTSSSKNFIDAINPQYSIISVGKNNRYGHPNKEVLNVLEDTKIYRTDKDGSIIFNISHNKLEIETCTP